MEFKPQSELLELSVTQLGLSQPENLFLEEIEKGGSERRFYRLSSCEIERSLIVLEYGSHKKENGYYAAIARFMESCGVPAPRIVAENELEQVLWVEDVGSLDLHDLSGTRWGELKVLYEKVLHGVAPLHGVEACQRALEEDLPMMPGFDEASYQWERDYFRENFLIRVLAQSCPDQEWMRIEEEGRRSALMLCQAEQVLVHRDFQSQNIMVHENQIAFIDFQGLRPGVAEYDLASLIYDPYARLSSAQQKELVELIPYSFSDELLKRAGVQRLMQALGAYGYLGIVQGKQWFLQHIDFAQAQLLELAAELGLNNLAARLR
ncbi:MAG: phosphotransferase [Verrucomicrobiota bacterium]